VNKSERMKLYWLEVRLGERPKPKRKESSGVVRRKVRCNSSWVRRSEIIVTVYPHGELGFREPGKRSEFKLGMAEAYRMAVTITTNKINARVRELKKLHGLAQARRMARKEVGL